MKKIYAVIAIVSLLGFGIPVSAHHAAEGIISDEIWEMIDGLLISAESPHLDMSFVSMDRTITTTVEVDSEYVDTIISELNGMDRRALSVEIGPDQDGVTEITITERIGAGNSQLAPAMMP